jgi:hypothetical protein
MKQAAELLAGGLIRLEVWLWDAADEARHDGEYATKHQSEASVAEGCSAVGGKTKDDSGREIYSK